MRQWLLLGVLLLSACAPSLRHYDQLDQKLLARQYDEADRLVQEHFKAYGDRNVLLYYFDRAMLLHLAGRYHESNAFFEKAKTAIDRLYTESILTHTSALISNDNLLPYDGEDFEKVLVHLFSALNYAALEKWDEALVEARQVDARLNQLNDQYEKKNVYKKDAFARYLAGVLYETRGEINDAFISYQKAYDAFQDYKKDYHAPIPSRLGYDLLKMSALLHLDEEFSDYKEHFPATAARFPIKEDPNEGELAVVAYTGRAPIKEDVFVRTLIPNGEGGTFLLTIAFPTFVPRVSGVSQVELRLKKADSSVRLRLDLVEDVTAIAKKNLEDRVGRITAKAIARATAKYMATRKARKEIAPNENDPVGQLIGLIGNVYSVATEQSDKRSWRTLPDRIYLGRIRLSEGIWDAEIRFFGQGGELVETRQFPNIQVRSGQKRFLLAHTFR